MTNAEPPFPVYANGAVHPAGTPVLAAEDQGFLLGLSVYDTLLVEEGCIYFLEDHLARLARGAAELGIAWPPPWDPAEALQRTAEALDGRAAALRITLTRGVPGRGPTLVVTPRALERLPAAGVDVLVSAHKKLVGNPLESLKSTNRLRNVLAREEAQRHGAWEALFPTDQGDLTEGTVSNLFVVVDGELRTPPIERGCLGGITREKLLASLTEEPLPAPNAAAGTRLAAVCARVETEDLRRADEVVLTNTTQRVIPIRSVLGLEPPVLGLPGGAGHVARALRERLARLEDRYRQERRARQGQSEPAARG
jgi:branched-chain amino acid aminotransferase